MVGVAAGQRCGRQHIVLTVNDLQRVSHKFQKLGTELTGPALKTVGTAVGEAAKDDVLAKVKRDAGGNDSLSGWRNSTLKIGAQYTVKGDTVTVTPENLSRGPMRVLNDGRHQGNASGFSGPGVSKDGTTKRTKAGKVRKVRSRQASRWNGRTRGKGTWDDAIDVVVRETPDRALKVLMDESVDKLFGG